MNIIEKSIKEIIPYEKNPRMNDDAVEQVAESIRQYGFNVPLVLDTNNVIICGHTRYKASKLLGLDKIPCIIADNLNEEQVKAYRIADNKVSDFSIWDNKLLLAELEGLDDLFTGFEFSEMQLDILDESDKSVIDNNDYGVTYEVVLRSEDREKVEKIKQIWEDLDKPEKEEDGKQEK